MKKKELTVAQFQVMVRNAQSIPFSPFAKFCLDCRGYKFKTAYGTEVSKFEIWDMGYRNAKDIINGNCSNIYASKK
jgi:hypothetical protein